MFCKFTCKFLFTIHHSLFTKGQLRCPLNNNLYYNNNMNDIRAKITELKIGRKDNGIVIRCNRNTDTSAVLDNIAQTISNGAGIIELVGCGMSDGELLGLAKKTKQLCEMFGAMLIIRNRADIAHLSSADGVNLEQDALDIHSVREIVEKECIVGLYINSREDLIRSVKDGADYISVGNIMSTPTEPVTSTGLEYAKWVSENTSSPVLFCGNFSIQQKEQLKMAGATRFLTDGTI